MKDNLICALQVLTAEYVPVDKFVDEIIESRTPLDFLIEKESTIYRRSRVSRKHGASLDKEVREFVEIISDLPPDAFFKDGVVKKGSLYKACKTKKSWSASKVEALKKELKFFLKGVSL